jgi:GH24 family phage-related lysozyme (muramidase)
MKSKIAILFLSFTLWTMTGWAAFLTYRIHVLESAAPVERVIERVIYTPAAPEIEVKKKDDTLLESAANIIKNFEGCKLCAYNDPRTGGLPITIGYGATRKLDGSTFKLGDKITKSEAEELLITQLREQYIPRIARVPFWNEMPQNKKVALISFGYNLGKDFYGHVKFQTITKQLAAREWKKIPDTLKLYSNPKSNVHESLLKRREREGNLWAVR